MTPQVLSKSQQTSSRSSTSQRGTAVCTAEPHVNGTKQTEEDPVKLVVASSLLLIQPHTC